MERLMFRILMAMLFAAGLFALAPGVESFAQEKNVTAKEKKGTCEFGADDQKLKGTERKAFISKCMAKEDSTAKKSKPKPKKKAEEKKSDG
jgi:hypothetical protein